jgi:hypothetical protein
MELPWDNLRLATCPGPRPVLPENVHAVRMVAASVHCPACMPVRGLAEPEGTN